jgi:hypothetical protein
MSRVYNISIEQERHPGDHYWSYDVWEGDVEVVCGTRDTLEQIMQAVKEAVEQKEQEHDA